MKRVLLILTLVGLLMSCDSNDDTIEINEQNYLIFGHFYGECGGERCVETFKLTDKNLFEDTIDDYLGENLDFVELSSEKFELVKDIETFFPSQLLNNNDTVIGCPDCADGGGLFIQYSENGNTRSWRIDQMKNNVPEYLHEFIDKVNEKIRVINE